METWEKALRLEEFIKFYIPKGFQEPIKEFDYTPTITEANYNFFEKNFSQPDFGVMVCGYADVQFRDEKIYRFNKRYIVEAITEYFKNLKP